MELNIKNRRYIGNKSKLVDFICDCIKKEEIEFTSFGDIFAGTGVIAQHFATEGKDIIINDLLYSNYVIYEALMNSQEYNKNKILRYIEKYNEIDSNQIQDNYFSDNFSNTYYHYLDAKKIGYIRENIENEKKSNKINRREYYILITCLLYSMDRISNTVGHYESFLNKLPEYKDIKLYYVEIKKYTGNIKIFNEDANKLVKKIQTDVMYLDPPYNARQYANFYHLLENIAKWEKPEVYNKAKKMERKNIMSDYCKSNAKEVFKDLINNINSKYIVVSYNNTYEAKSTSSVNTIAYEDMIEILRKKGKIKIYETNYKFFNSGKTNFKHHTERVFICKVK